jgi:hypothetical protein
MRIALVIAPLIVLAAACSSSSSTGSAAPGGDDGGGGGGDPDASDAAVDHRTSACNLQAIDGVAAVTPTFKFYDPPTTVPAATTGGNPSGRYVVTAATFYLPTNTKSVAHPDKSTGTLTAWSVFEGTSYRLFLHATATIDTSLGPQPQKNDVASQGGFTVDKDKLVVDYSCDTAPPDPLPEFTFSDDGAGNSTLVIKSTTTFGDGYLEITAKRQ